MISRKLTGLFSGIVTAGMLSACSSSVSPVDGPLTAVSFENVELTDSFWRPRLQIQKETLVPFSLEKTAPAVENLRRTAEFLKTGKKIPLEPLARYVDSDLFKVMEGAAYLLSLDRDPALEAQMDSIIDIIADAQAEDGYLYEQFQVDDSMVKRGWGMGDRPYSFVVHSHELYNMGHMYEGAIAYFKATGKRKWLDVAEKNARHINKVFFEGDPRYNDGKPVNQAPGHEEIELALVKMFHTTGDSLYLDMARKFIDIRGVTYKPDGEGVMAADYSQQHKPVREQKEVSGHSVRAMYLYSGMADVMGASGDTTLLAPLESIWHDYVDSKMHINGGLGAIPGIEGFGPEYVLPNKDTYDETCAAVGNVLFNYRMFLATVDAKYLDVAEIALFNNVLAGVNLEGNRFFYVNVLEADGRKAFNHGRAGRSPWFGTACCPSNMARLIPQVAGMIYSHTGNDLFCALYAGSEGNVKLENGKVNLRQSTGYPFDGNVRIEVSPESDGQEFTVWMRIPTWATDRFLPGNLYSYADNNKKSSHTLKVNGKRITESPVKGFVPVTRKWNSGDVIELELPMPLRYSEADRRVEADIDRVALTRGPLVLCAEGIDNAYQASSHVVSEIGEQGETGRFKEGVLAGIPFVKLPAMAVDSVQNVHSSLLTLIPYYAWNNRGDNGTMNVWFARHPETATASLFPVTGPVRNVAVSYTYTGDDPYAVADGKIPSSSSDATIPRWTAWPRLGEAQRVELHLKEAQPVESISVYWYNDDGGVKLPKSWTIDYLKDGKWVPMNLYTTDSYGVKADQFNMVHPAQPITTDAIRINVVPVDDASVGILEAVIE